MDTVGTGLVTYENFINVLSKTDAKELKEEAADSFAWEENILDMIKTYAQSNKMSPDELFKALDCDFDGIISIDDLRSFLSKNLDQKEIKETKIERLYKLLDQNKSGKVQIADIKKLVSALSSEEKFSWKKNAIQ